MSTWESRLEKRWVMASSESIFKKTWHDPVWSKVIAGAIMAFVFAGISYFVGWWTTILCFFKRVLSLLLASTPVPNWLLAILSIPVILMLLLFIAVIFPSKKEADWRSYTSDNFFGVFWSWRFNSIGGIFEKDIQPRCPHCLSVLEPN